jgi:large subunit ribosomal protein L3
MNSNPGIIGKKLGMTQYFAEDGNIVRCTVIESDLTVLGKRTKAKDGYDALIVGLGERAAKHASKPVAGQYAKKEGKNGLFRPTDDKSPEQTPKRVVRELRLTAAEVAKHEVGSKVALDQIFEPGQFVDVQGTTRGRGFTGVVRRWGMAGSVQTHGTHEYRRHGGSIGTNMTPGRTLPGLKMPGQYGNETVSVLNLKVGRVIPEKSMVLIVGAVPGARNGIVTVRRAVKKRPDAHKIVHVNTGKGGKKAE